mgnify:CR=1 FL=1
MVIIYFIIFIKVIQLFINLIFIQFLLYYWFLIHNIFDHIYFIKEVVVIINFVVF